MLSSSVSTALAAIAFFASSTWAMPSYRPPPAVHTPASDLSVLANLMPQSALPAPQGQLKYVVLGIGTQNYTCLSGDPKAVPGTTGAVATLYDIGTKLTTDPNAKSRIPTLSPLALSLSQYPQDLTKNLAAQGYDNIIGHHFFAAVDGTNTPTFALDQLPQPYPIAQVAKLNDTAAPASACPGLQGEGAVRWLLLADTKGLSKGGINTVYRLETAGGAAPATCEGRPQNFEVPYAAQYWIYGPGSEPVIGV